MKELNRRDFEFTIQNNPVTILVCTTPMCGVCHMLCSRIEKDFEEKYKNIKFLSYDVSTDVDDLSEKFEIRNVPTTLVFKYDKLCHKYTGFVRPDELDKQCKKLESSIPSKEEESNVQ